MAKKLILGVKFGVGSPAEVVAAGLQSGLVVIPSAPVLVRMTEDAALREAVLNADMAITDSGLMVLLWRCLEREKLERVSGLEYLKLLLHKLKAESGKLKADDSDLMAAENPQASHVGGVFWVMPTASARDRNLAWLQAAGHPTTAEDCFIAPQYPAAGPLADADLLEWVRQRRPQHIIICLGGGVQERLGYYLRQELRQLPASSSKLIAYNPGIHCVGAAIGFLTGDQVRIPMWADYLYLGWLWRCLSAPRLYVPRYWKAARLVGLLLRYRDKAPPAMEQK